MIMQMKVMDNLVKGSTDGDIGVKPLYRAQEINKEVGHKTLSRLWQPYLIQTESPSILY